MSYQGGEYIPGIYGKDDNQAFMDIVSAEEFSTMVPLEVANIDALRSDFYDSCLDISDYADDIRVHTTMKSINQFPEVGDANIQKFHKYVTSLMKFDETDPSMADALTASSISEIAKILRARTFGESDYLEPTVDDIAEAIAESRRYDDRDVSRIARCASDVYAEFLSYNMASYVKYIAETRNIRGLRGRGGYLSNIQKNLPKLGMGLVDNYLFKRDIKNFGRSKDNE